MAETKTVIPIVDVPDGTVDASQLICALRLRADEKETYANVFNGFESIDRGNPILLKGGSKDHEQLLTRHGMIALNGQMFSWVLRGKEISLATLWERYPQYRQYLRSRTESFIFRAHDENRLLDLDDAWSCDRLNALEQQLRLLVSEEDE